MDGTKCSVTALGLARTARLHDCATLSAPEPGDALLKTCRTSLATIHQFRLGTSFFTASISSGGVR